MQISSTEAGSRLHLAGYSGSTPVYLQAAVFVHANTIQVRFPHPGDFSVGTQWETDLPLHVSGRGEYRILVCWHGNICNDEAAALIFYAFLYGTRIFSDAFER